MVGKALAADNINDSAGKSRSRACQSWMAGYSSCCQSSLTGGKPLPPLGSVAPTSKVNSDSTFTPDREALWASIVSGQFFLEKGKSSIEPKPPWRQPGAFNWVEEPRSNLLRESMLPSNGINTTTNKLDVDEDEEDMDFSE